MSDDARRIRVAEDTAAALRRVHQGGAALLARPPDRGASRRSSSSETLERAHVEAPDVVIGVVDRQVVVDGVPLLGSHGTAETVERFRAIGVERIAFDRGVTGRGTGRRSSAASRAAGARGATTRRRRASRRSALPHIHVGRLTLQQRMDAGRSDIARDAGRATGDAVAGAERLWEQAQAEGSPDPAPGHRARRGPGERGRAEPAGHDGADRAVPVRQLHVHAHGERQRADHGPGAEPGHRRHAAPAVRPGRPDARHREDPDARRDPDEAGPPDRRRSSRS